MTNKELETKFEEISLSDEGVFDKYQKLQGLEKEYLTTPVAKLPIAKTVYAAYQLYLEEYGKFNVVTKILKKSVTDLLNSEQFEEILGKISLEGLVDDLDGAIQNLGPDVTEILKSFMGVIKK